MFCTSVLTLILNSAVMWSFTVHETQMSEGGEGDLKNHKENCLKNPGHSKFTSIDSFTLHHLPKSHQDKDDLYELILAVAVLTLRVTVATTSLNRPEFVPNTKIPYFLADKRGQNTFRTGTGIVRGVKKNMGEDNKRINNKTCPCHKCKDSDKRTRVWWEVYVLTAAHVVFDDIEADHTSMRLFYDNEDSEVVIINDTVCVNRANIEKDTCLLTCVTCDAKLGPKLEKAWGRYEDLWHKISNKYTENRDVDKLAFIVSHPHGCSKQVSVGQWVDKEKWGEFVDYKFTYSTCTCPGTSGAHVHCVGYSVSFIDHVHSGCTDSGINVSSVGAVIGADAETI